jgi:hypothetical protein
MFLDSRVCWFLYRRKILNCRNIYVSVRKRCLLSVIAFIKYCFF